MTNRYTFNLINHSSNEPIDKDILAVRPFIRLKRNLYADADRFVPGSQLETAINTAIALGEPLLITGEPGTGKTQAAYYTAYKLGLKEVLHFQVKSDSTARDLLYSFDTVRYFHDAQLSKIAEPDKDLKKSLDKVDYIDSRPLWDAFKIAEKTGMPQVLLIDEIDKAPRDFPNDLLYELDQMKFNITELRGSDPIQAPVELRPIVFITSNNERRLPDPFLRRCVYHNIQFDAALAEKAVLSRRGDYSALSDDFIRWAVQRFLTLRGRNLHKKPSLSELLVWLNVLSVAIEANIPIDIDDNIANTPYIGVLLKNRQDIDEVLQKNI